MQSSCTITTFPLSEIAKSKNFEGRKEQEFISKELYRDNGIFITNDLDFINYALEERPKNSGIVYVGNFKNDDLINYSKVIAGFLWGATEYSSYNLRNQILYPAPEGLYMMIKGKDEFIFSWDSLDN